MGEVTHAIKAAASGELKQLTPKLRGLGKLFLRWIDVDFPFKQVNRRAANMAGVEVRVCTDPKSTHHGNPPCHAPSNGALRNPDSDPVRYSLQRPDRGASNKKAFPDANNKIPHGLGRRMPEEAIEHLLAGEIGLFAIAGSNIGDHLSLQLPDSNQFGKNRQPAKRTRRKCKTSSNESRLRSCGACDFAGASGGICALAFLTIWHAPNGVQNRGGDHEARFPERTRRCDCSLWHSDYNL